MQFVAVHIRMLTEQVLELLPVYGHAGIFDSHTMTLESVNGIDDYLAIGQQSVFRRQVDFFKLNIEP